MSSIFIPGPPLPAPSPAGTLGRGPAGQPVMLGTSLAAVHEFAPPPELFRGVATFQIWNWGPGNVNDFEIWAACNDLLACPMSPYIGPDDIQTVGGYLANANVVKLYPSTWPSIPPNVATGDAAIITFRHQFYSKIRLYLASDTAGTVVQVFTQG